MTRLVIGLCVIWLAGVAYAQTPATLGDSAKRVVGSWEFSNADRDRTCTATLKSDSAPGGLKIEFDANCANLFPQVRDIAAWKFPENDLLYFVEAPTPGVGVLFLQNAAAAGAPPKPPEQIAGDWAMVRKSGPPVCTLTLGMTKASDGFAVAVKPGCESGIARLNFTQWRIDRDQLMLVPTRGNPWRFEEIDNTVWRRVPESADQTTLVRQ